MIQYIHNIMTYLPYILIVILLGIIIVKENSTPNKFQFKDYLTDENGLASTSKSLQLLGGLSGTAIIIQQSVSNTLTSDMFLIYLGALGVSASVSKLISAKYGVTNG